MRLMKTEKELAHEAIRKQVEAAHEAGDLDLAITLLTQLAQEENSKACVYLGLIYRTEKEVQDSQLSTLWYSRYVFLLKKRAEAGDLESLFALGNMYQYGDILKQDEKKAVSIYQQCADAGLIEAQFHLSGLYQYGWCGCPMDEDSFLYWLEKAVSNHHPEALYTKGLYLSEDGVPSEESYSLIRQSAQLGFWPAKEYLERRNKNW